MPDIPSSEVFRRNTKPLSKFVRTGSNMVIVQAALEAYWEGRATGQQQIEERLLYNLWKESRRWLKKKLDKPPKKQSSELFVRRKWHIENLRDAAMERLVDVSPRVAEALTGYKGQGVRNVQLQPLSPGYNRERESYVNQGKSLGFSSSQSHQYGRFRGLQNSTGQKERNFHQSLKGKSFENLSPSEVAKLEQLVGMVPVVFRNKIERLHHMVRITEDGKLCDFEENPLLMDEMSGIGENRRYDKWMYAMDQYGNLFIERSYGQKSFINYVKGQGYVRQNTDYFNHSSFLAGKDCLCAGCIHIGYNAVTRQLEEGVLSHIDNNSGHYKPTREQLQNCLLAIGEQGVDLRYVRVMDVSDRQQGPQFWWGDDFAYNGFANRWQDVDTPGTGIVLAPSIVET